MFVLRVAALFLSMTAVGQFEVASVREHQGPLRVMETYTIHGPRLDAGGVTVSSLIAYAYNLKNYQVSVKEPAWARETFYDVAAKAEGDVTLSKADARKMMQTLLTERFKIKLRVEQREMPVYALTVDGLKLKESTVEVAQRGHIMASGGLYEYTEDKATIDDLVQVISTTGAADRPIVDKTGLTGTYDIRLTFTPKKDTEDGLSIFVAINKQLGLKLVPQKSMVDITVVEHVEKPSEN